MPARAAGAAAAAALRRRVGAALLLAVVACPLLALDATAQDAVDPAEGMQGLMAQLQRKIAEQQKEAGHPYVDADKDGKLTTEEVRAQWSSWMEGAEQAGRDQDWEKMVGLLHKVLHAPGPGEATIRYNLGVALYRLSEVEGASERYGGTNFVAAAKGELYRSIEIASEEGKTEVAERSKKMVQSLPKHVEAAEHFAWPEPPAGATHGVRTDGHKVKYGDEPDAAAAAEKDGGDGAASGKKSKKTKKTMKKKKKKAQKASEP
jgi:hypothetical protein